MKYFGTLFVPLWKKTYTNMENLILQFTTQANYDQVLSSCKFYDQKTSQDL